jgi:hypothetical protein
MRPKHARIVSLFLIPSLLMDPATAAAFVSPSTGFSCASPVLLSQTYFSQQALSAQAWLSGRQLIMENVPEALTAFVRGMLRSSSHQSVRRGLLAAIPAFLFAAPRLIAQTLEGEPQEVRDKYNDLLRSNLSPRDLLKTLFRESARQAAEITALTQNGQANAEQTKELQRINALQTQLIWKVVREFHNRESTVFGTLKDIFSETAEPLEKLYILETATRVLNELASRGERLAGNIYEDTWDPDLIRALLNPTTSAAAQQLIARWISHSPTIASFLLEESGLARLRNDTRVFEALDGVIQDHVTPQMLLSRLLEFDSATTRRPVVAHEALRRLAASPDLSTLNWERINSVILQDLLASPDLRSSVLLLLQSQLHGTLDASPQKPRTASEFDRLRFNEKFRGFIWQGSGDRAEEPIPALEGFENARAMILRQLLTRASLAEATRDVQWAAQIRQTLRPFLREPQTFLAFLSQTVDREGGGDGDARNFAVEGIIADVVDSLSEQDLGRITLHDPRLVAGLLRMKYRFDPKVAKAAARALQHIRIDSTDEAMQAAAPEQEGIARTWAGISIEQEERIHKLKGLMIRSQGKIDQFERFVSESGDRTLQSLLARVETGQAMGVMEALPILRALANVLESEQDPESSFAILQVLDHLHNKYPVDVYSSRVMISLIQNLQDPKRSLEVARFLAKPTHINRISPEIFSFLWSILRPRVLVAIEAGTVEKDPVLQLLMPAVHTHFGLPHIFIPLLSREEDPRIFTWMATLRGIPGPIDDPRLVLSLVEKIDDPTAGPVAQKGLASVDRFLVLFRDELLVRRVRSRDEGRGLEELLSHVWMQAFNPESADHAVSVLNGRAGIPVRGPSQRASVRPELKVLDAFRRSLENPEPSIQAQAVVAASHVTFRGNMPRVWLEELLNMRLLAIAEGSEQRQRAIETVLTAYIQTAANQEILRTIASTSPDQRLRDSAQDLLKRLGIAPPAGIAPIGFAAGAMLWSAKIKDPKQLSRRNFFGAGRKSFAPPEQRKPKTSGFRTSRAKASSSMRRHLLKVFPIFLLSVPRLFAQTLEGNREVSDRYNTLKASGKPVPEILRVLFREAARQVVELARQGSAELQRLHGLQTQLIRRVMDEFPGGEQSMLKSVMDFFLQSSEPVERQYMLQRVGDYFEKHPIAPLENTQPGTPARTFNRAWGENLLRALMHPASATDAARAIRLWIPRDVHFALFLLEASAIARLQGDGPLLSAIDDILQDTIPSSLLWNQAMVSLENRLLVGEAVQRLATRSDLSTLDITPASFNRLSVLLSDATTRSSALVLIRQFLENGSSASPGTSRTAMEFNRLQFDERSLGFNLQQDARAIEHEALPPLEGADQKQAVFLRTLMKQALEADVTQDKEWSAEIKMTLAPFLKDPQMVPALLTSAVHEQTGADERNFQAEEMIAGFLNGLTEEALADVTLHDPRLVAVLLRMKHRFSADVSKSAQRALQHIRVDSTVEAMRAVKDEARSRVWAGFPDDRESTVGTLKDWVVQADGHLDQVDVLAARTPSDVSAYLRRLRDYAKVLAENPQMRIQLQIQYREERLLIRAFADAVEAERHPDRRHAMLRFLQELGSPLSDGFYSAGLTADLIGDLENSKHAISAARLLSRPAVRYTPYFVTYLWKALRVRIGSALQSGRLGSDPVLLPLLPILSKQFEVATVGASLLIQEEDPALVEWLLRGVKGHHLQDPRVIMKLIDLREDPVAGLSAQKALAMTPAALRPFRDALLARKRAQASVGNENPFKALESFRNALDAEYSAAPAIEIASRASFDQLGDVYFWLDGLLNMRLMALAEGATRRQRSVEQVLTAQLRIPAHRDVLQTIAHTSLDQRLRDSAYQTLGTPAPSGIGSFGFAAGAIAVGVSRMQRPDRITRRSFFGGARKSFAPPEQKKPKTSGFKKARRVLLKIVPITLLSAPHLLAQAVVGEPQVNTQDFEALIHSKKKLVDILKVLFKEASRLTTEAERMEQTGNSARAESLRKESALQEAIIQKLLREFPGEDLGGKLNSLEMVFEFTQEPREKRHVLQVLNGYMDHVTSVIVAEGDDPSTLEVFEQPVFLKALIQPDLQSMASGLLQRYGQGRFLLEQSDGALLRNDKELFDLLDRIIQVKMTTSDLLKILFSSYPAKPELIRETLRRLAERADVSSSDLRGINMTFMNLRLENPDIRSSVLAVIAQLLIGQDSLATERSRERDEFKDLVFNESIKGFSEVTTNELQPMPWREGETDGDSYARMMQGLLLQWVDANEVGDTAWAAEIKNAILPFLKSPHTLLAMVSELLKDDQGQDARNFPLEEIFAEVVDALSDDDLAAVQIHDPRLVAALLRMKYRFIPKVVAAATRALKQIQIDSTVQVTQTLGDETMERIWADMPLERQKEFEDVLTQISNSSTDLTALRTRILASPDPQGLLALLDGALEMLALDSRYRLLRVLDYPGRSGLLSNKTSRFTAVWIRDLASPHAREAASLLARLSRSSWDGQMYAYLWKFMRMPLVAALKRGGIREDDVELENLLTALSPGFEHPAVFIPLLISEQDPRLVKWLLPQMSEHMPNDPRVITWLVSKLNDPDVRSEVRNVLERLSKEGSQFRDVLLARQINDLERRPDWQPVLFNVWTTAFNPEDADHALGVMNPQAMITVDGADLSDQQNLLDALRRSLDHPRLELREKAVKIASQVSFGDKDITPFWLESLLNMRTMAQREGNEQRQQNLDRILNAQLKKPRSRAVLQKLIDTSNDQRVREAGRQKLGLPPITDPSRFGFIIGAIGMGIAAKIEDTTPISRQHFFGRRKSFAPAKQKNTTPRRLLSAA